MKISKELSASGLFGLVRKGFSQIKDLRTKAAEISLVDVLMSGFALFSLNAPSSLAFEGRRQKPENLHTIYGIEDIPSDTYLRTVLDDVNPEALRPVSKAVFRQWPDGKVLEPYLYLGNYYLLSLEGTGSFSSHKISCPNCLEKHRHNGETLYHHQMLGAAIVHPALKTVIPLMPEAIRKQAGAQKNDCERHAATRQALSTSIFTALIVVCTAPFLLTTLVGDFYLPCENCWLIF